MRRHVSSAAHEKTGTSRFFRTARRTRLGHEYFCKQKFLDPASLALRHRSGFQVSAKRAQARFFRRARVILLTGHELLIHFIHKHSRPRLAILPPCGRQNIAPTRSYIRKQSSLLSKHKTHHIHGVFCVYVTARRTRLELATSRVHCFYYFHSGVDYIFAMSQ